MVTRIKHAEPSEAQVVFSIYPPMIETVWSIYFKCRYIYSFTTTLDKKTNYSTLGNDF